MQTPRGHLHVRGHRAIHAVAEAFARRAQIVAARAAQHALAAHLRRRLAHHAIAFAEMFHGASRVGDRPTELMAEDHRNIHRPRMGVVRLVNVRSADRDRPDAQQHVGVADLGHRHFA